MSKDLQIIVVDENDVVVGSKSRGSIDYSKDIYRVACLWVTNSKGEILITQRKHTKAHDPLKWQSAVAGTVEEGETYESNMYKEAEEEIGLTGCAFTRGPKQFVSHSKKFFIQWYFCVVDKPADEFILQEDEVEAAKWIDKDVLIQDAQNNPGTYVESMPSVVELLLR